MYVVRYHVTRIKSEIIKAQKKQEKHLEAELGPYNFLAFYHSLFWYLSYNEVRANCLSISSLECGGFRSAKKKNIFCPTLYGFRDDVPHM